MLLIVNLCRISISFTYIASLAEPIHLYPFNMVEHSGLFGKCTGSEEINSTAHHSGHFGIRFNLPDSSNTPFFCVSFLTSHIEKLGQPNNMSEMGQLTLIKRSQDLGPFSYQ